MTVCTEVLSLALRDFRSRRKIRKQSRHMFRNFVRTLLSLYPAYRQIDKCLSSCLIEPIFRCLQALVDERPDDADLKCVAQIVIGAGQSLSQLNPNEVDSTLMKCRRWLATNQLPLEEETKLLLMTANDLWTYSWDWSSFPDCLQRFYAAYEEKKVETSDQKATAMVADAPQELQRDLRAESIV